VATHCLAFQLIAISGSRFTFPLALFLTRAVKAHHLQEWLWDGVAAMRTHAIHVLSHHQKPIFDSSLRPGRSSGA
jgi:hypothetical protein